jgi:hypothetical protein
MVPGWENSAGATAERQHAQNNGIPVFYTIDGLKAWL